MQGGEDTERKKMKGRIRRVRLKVGEVRKHKKEGGRRTEREIRGKKKEKNEKKKKHRERKPNTRIIRKRKEENPRKGRGKNNINIKAAPMTMFARVRRGSNRKTDDNDVPAYFPPPPCDLLRSRNTEGD